MAGETVLVIDDSAELQSVLETILPYGGYQVFVASDGAEGLSLIRLKNPDLIMVDLELPDTSGLKILERLNGQGISIPTIMMTGYGSEGVAARALRLGVRDYLIKPFTAEEVLSSLDRALTESRLRRERDHLKGRLADYARHLKLIATVGRTIAAGLKPAEAWQRILGSAVYVTHAEAACLLVRDADDMHLRLLGAEGPIQYPPAPIPLTSGDHRLRPVLTRRTAVTLSSADSASIVLQTGDRVRAVVQVPLLGWGRVLGLLSVDRRHQTSAFTDYDRQLLMILADYASLVLEQSRRA